MKGNRMNCLYNILTPMVLVALFHMIFPIKSYAYLDPGTGSYFLQLAIAALLGGLYAIKLFWKKIKAFFKNIFSTGKKV